MTSPSQSLSFDVLRQANSERLPVFKNKLGGAAHSMPDGSDWTPALWLTSLVGEVGEYAEVRHRFETGELSFEQYVVEAKKELADVQCYLDLLSKRALDKTIDAPEGKDAAQDLQQLVAGLGTYANLRKKLIRGDLTQESFALEADKGLALVEEQLRKLRTGLYAHRSVTVEAHPEGVDLGQATADKFNEVSRRVKAPIFIENDSVVRR